MKTHSDARRHRQSWVKVNAQVDAGIASLIELLNSIPGLQTIDSCQGHAGEGQSAYLYFRYGKWHKLCSLIFTVVGPAINREVESRVRVSIEAFDERAAVGIIEFNPESTTQVTGVVRKIVRSLAGQNQKRRRSLLVLHRGQSA